MTAKNRWTAWWGDKPVRLDAEECALIDPQTGKETTLFTLSNIQSKAAVTARKSVRSTMSPSPLPTRVGL